MKSSSCIGTLAVGCVAVLAWCEPALGAEGSPPEPAAHELDASPLPAGSSTPAENPLPARAPGVDSTDTASARPSPVGEAPAGSDVPRAQPRGDDSAKKESPSVQAGQESVPAGYDAVEGGSATVVALRDESAEDALRVWREQLEAGEIEAYCEHVRAAQRSEQARLRSPWVAGRGSTLQRGELRTSADAVVPRFRAGVGFSPSDWLQADLLGEHAEQSCAVYRAEVKSRTEVYDVDVITLESWRDKARALEEAIAAASPLVANSAAELARGERTIAQHLAVLSDHQRLQQQSSEALRRVARLSAVAPPPEPGGSELSDLRRSVSDLEQVEGALRRSRALSIELEGGYDEIVGAPQSLPVYAQVSVTFRPGYFWQLGADERAASARAHAAVLRASSADVELRRAALTLQAQRPALEAEARRLREFIETLKRQEAVLKTVVNAHAKLLAERLWFELRLLQAELGQVESSLRAIDEWSRGAAR